MMAHNEVTYTQSSRKGNMEGKELQTDPTSCGDCDSGDHAVCYCQDCSCHLCIECKNSHQRSRRTKGHLLKDLGTGGKPVKCPEHTNSNVTYFCKTCTDIACETCITKLHKSHKFGSLDEYSKEVKELLLEYTKRFQGPFDDMKKGEDEILKSEKTFMSSCDQTKNQILKRRKALIDMITKLSEAALEEVDTTKKEARAMFVDTTADLSTILNACEQIVTPLVMRSDIEAIVRKIVFLKVKLQQSDNVVGRINDLQNFGSLELEGDTECLTLIGQTAKVYFAVRRDVPMASNAHVKAYHIQRMPSPKTGITQKSKPRKVILKCDEKVPTWYSMSKHINQKSYVVQHQSVGDIKLLSYKDKPLLFDKQPIFPNPLHTHGSSILTLSESRHIIISRDFINLCNNKGVVHSVPHTDDGYKPRILAYMNSDVFGTVDTDTNQVRYHSTNDLSVLHTYTYDKLDRGLLMTRDGDLLVKTSKKVMMKYTPKTDRKIAVSFDETLFKCDPNTECIDNNNNIFAVGTDGSIHVFDIHGGHNELGKLQHKPNHMFGASVDDECNLYISYDIGVGKERMAKYELIF